MARARTVKPEFFTHEGLASCDPHARLLAIGLLQLADREGRLRWLPTQIHGNIFPFEPHLDVKHLGKQLVKQNFLHLYSVDGKDYAVIVNFTKHQRISGKEASTPSFIPPPPQVVTQQPSSPGSTQGSTEVLHQLPPNTLIPLVLNPESSTTSRASLPEVPAASPGGVGEGLVSSDESPQAEQALAVQVRALGAANGAGAIREARDHGVTLAEIRSIVAAYTAKPGAWGPGALDRRIRQAQPGENPEQHWPPVDPVFARKQARIAEARAGPPVPSAEQRREQGQAAAAELERRFGPLLDAMNRDEFMSSLPKIIRESKGGNKWPLQGHARSLAIARLAGSEKPP